MSESTNGQNNPIGSFYPILWSCIYATAVQFCFSPGHQELNICDQKQRVVRRSTLAQRERDGPATQRSLDRNQKALTKVSFPVIALK
jgi:hypothetical protein